MASSVGLMNLQFVDETGIVEEADDDPRCSSTSLPSTTTAAGTRKRRSAPGAGGGGRGDSEDDEDLDDDDDEACLPMDSSAAAVARQAPPPRPGKKTRGRVKIRMAYISDKVRRYTTFSKRKTGIMKKAYELAVLTGTQVMLLVASETGHVYTFATKKLQPVIMSENGKALIQTCLNSPDAPPSPRAKDVSTAGRNDERMNPLGFEEPSLTYAAVDEKNKPVSQFNQSGTVNEPISSENHVQITTVPVLSTPLEQSTVSAPSVAISQLSKSVLQPGVTAVGAYIAALNESKVGTVPENVVTVLPQAASVHEATSQSQQLYYRIEGSNRLISIPIESCSSITDEKLKLNSLTSQPVAVVNSGANSAGMLMYPGQPTVVLPVQDATTRNLLSEGYLLNITNASNLVVAADGSGSIPQPIFTLPFTVSSAQVSQTNSTPTGLANPNASFANGQRKVARRK